MASYGVTFPSVVGSGRGDHPAVGLTGNETLTTDPILFGHFDLSDAHERSESVWFVDAGFVSEMSRFL